MLNIKLKLILFIGVIMAFTQMCANYAFAENKVEITLNYDGVNHKYSEYEIKICIDGNPINDFVVPPVSIDGRTLIPARAMCEKLGAEVNWNEETSEIYIAKESDIIVIQIGNTMGNKNGNTFTMETPPKIINGNTMIPARNVAEALGYTVSWNGNTRTVEVNKFSVNEVLPKEVLPEDVIKKEISDNNEIAVLSVSVTHDVISAETFIINLSEAVEKFEHIIVSENRLVVDIYNANMQIVNSETILNGNKYVYSIRSAQNQIEPNKIARVVFDLKTNYNCNVSLSDDKKNIFVSFGVNLGNSIGNSIGITGNNQTETIPPITPTVPQPVPDTLKNLSYDYSSQTLILAKYGSLSADAIIHEDDYTNKKYKFMLNGDYNELYGSGTYNVNDTYLSGVSVNSLNGQTVITINENKVFAYIVTEDSVNIYIKAVNPKEIYNKIVVIDPGHGGSAPGNLGIDSSLIEKNLNLDLGLRLYRLLEADPNIKVYSTRLTDVFPENPDRAALANDIGDLFVSIHQNAFTSSIPNGTETLYVEHPNEVEGMLTSKLAAQFIQEYLVSAMGTTDRGVKRDAELIVLNKTKIPAVLFETVFLTNVSDAEKMKSESFKDTIAIALYSAIVDMLNQYPVR